MSWGFDLMKIADKNALTRLITRYTIRHSDMLAVDCQAVKDEAVKFGADPGKIVAFPWGVDLDAFSPLAGNDKGKQIRQQLGWDEQFIILGTRTWEPMYGMTVLAEALLSLPARIRAYGWSCWGRVHRKPPLDLSWKKEMLWIGSGLVEWSNKLTCLGIIVRLIFMSALPMWTVHPFRYWKHWLAVDRS
jgi:glycosyltransferase involved in cell wall biosynthesis